MNFIVPDYEQIGLRISEYVNQPEFFATRSKEELCNILDFAKLDVYSCIDFCQQIKQLDRYDICDITEIMNHVTINIPEDFNSLQDMLSQISEILGIRPIKSVKISIPQMEHANVSTQTEHAVEIAQTEQEIPEDQNKNIQLLKTKNKAKMEPIYTIICTAFEQNDIATIRYAVDNEYTKAKNGNGLTTFMSAACKGRKDLCKLLYELGDDATHKDVYNANALYYAVKYKRGLDFIQFLASIPNMDINIVQTNNNKSVLMEAVNNDDYEVTKFLLNLPGIDASMKVNNCIASNFAKSQKMKDLLNRYGVLSY